MDDDEFVVILAVCEAALKQALRPVEAKIASMTAALQAYNQRSDAGTALELPEVKATRTRHASQRNDGREK